MRALAEFIMRGRIQASLVAFLGSWFPLISPAAVALVSLRRGTTDGLLILMWAVLPAFAGMYVSDSEIGPLMVLITLAGLLVTYAVALLLRVTASWSQLLIGLVSLSCASALLLMMIIPLSVQALTNDIGELLTDIQAQAGGQALTQLPTNVVVLGLIAYVIAVSSLLSLLLARWWQSVLYNPGGFKVEFHALRLPPVATIVSAVAVLLCWQQGLEYHMWGNVFMLPLLLTGIAIVHRVVALRGMAVQWLILFYVALIFFGPLAVLLSIFAFMDTWLNIRQRLAALSSKKD